jgi:hypothetical protein
MIGRRFARLKTVKIGDGPSFNRELYDMLVTLQICRICPQSTLFYKCYCFTNITRLEEVLLFTELFWRQIIFYDFLLLICQADLFAKAFKK